MFWSIFTAIDKKLYLSTKKLLSQKKILTHREKFFHNEFEKGQILNNSFDLMEKTFFVQTIEMVQLLQKNVLLLKMSHIQLK